MDVTEEGTMTTYPDISDHGLIGDLQTAALVATDGTIDWFCCPRFDSPSVFASLLDEGRGGFFKIRPESGDFVTKQLYLPGTAILITRFMSDAGAGEVIDFMPVVDGPATDRHRLVRLVRVVRGEMRFVGEIQPRFGYGLAEHETSFTADGVQFVADDMTLTVHRVGEPIGEAEDRAAACSRRTAPVSAWPPPCTPVISPGSCWSLAVLLPVRSSARSSSPCSWTRGSTGGAGWIARPTGDGGARSCLVRRSRSS